MNGKQSFETIWQRIVDLAGQEFQTTTGRTFTFRIEDGTWFRPCPGGEPTNRRISRAALEQAWNVWPVEGPSKFPKSLMGTSYIWGIFSDPRITGGAVGS